MPRATINTHAIGSVIPALGFISTKSYNYERHRTSMTIVIMQSTLSIIVVVFSQLLQHAYP